MEQSTSTGYVQVTGNSGVSYDRLVLQHLIILFRQQQLGGRRNLIIKGHWNERGTSSYRRYQTVDRFKNGFGGHDEALQQSNTGRKESKH